MSAVLVRKEESGQYPVCFVSRVLHGAEIKYSELKKVALALVVVVRRLKPYFLGHPIIVRTNFPLTTTLGKIDVSGRMVKWEVELGQFDIAYEPRIAVKAQAFIDFLQEITRREEEQSWWKIYVHGSSTKLGAGGGKVLESPKKELEYAVRFQFKASNNEAEYEAVL